MIRLKFDNKKTILFFAVFFSVAAITFSASAQWQGQGDFSASWHFPQTHFRSLTYNVTLQGALENGIINDKKLVDAKALQVVYGERDHEPLWTGDKGNPDRIEAILQVLKNSWTHGLNPESYHTNKIEKLLKGVRYMNNGQLEILLSDAVIRYGRDLSGMRVDPKAIRQKAEYWRTPLDGETVLRAVIESDNPAKVLARMAPNAGLYSKLREELVRLTVETLDYDHILPLDFGTAYFKPGTRHKAISDLRVRLGMAFDPDDRLVDYYDDDLAAIVMSFQRAHGLDPDGIIGPKTLALLNLTKRKRLEQIIVNLERLRWLDQDRPERYLMVNIPNQKLWAIEKGRIVHEMDVVVGMPWRQTKSFKTEVTGIRFNPTWTVPLRIKMEDFLPKLKEDPSYLAEKDVELIRGYGRNAVTLDPMAINWHRMSWRKMGKIRMVQGPGDHNALGRIRVLMENPYNIYLHDTNHKEYFEREDRTLSSGCIRLSQPEKIADFVLSQNEDYSSAVRQGLIEAGEMIEVEAAAPMPVYILYQTMWLDDNGELVFGPDVYRRDKKLAEVLQAMNGYYIPEPGSPLYAGLQEARLASLE